MKKCNFNERAMSEYEREFGCPLDHCMCDTHDSLNEKHECKIPDYDPEILAAERAAGWDPNP